MKSQRGVRLPNAPATRKHGITKYDRQTEKEQNWRNYLEEMLTEDGMLEIIEDNNTDYDEREDDGYLGGDNEIPPEREEGEAEEEISEEAQAVGG